MKFGRIYHMEAQGVHFFHTIDFPLTCRFRVNHSTLPSGATATFQIYNLAPETRRDLYKDTFMLFQYRRIKFSAGYSSEMPIPTLFQGNIKTAYSYRQGPDWITVIEAYDGGFAKDNSYCNLSFPSPYQFDRVIREIVKTMEPNNVGIGFISEFVVPNNRGIVFKGNSWDVLVNAVLPLEAQVTIQNELVYILGQNDIIDALGTISVIDDNAGLLDSPIHMEGQLKCRMIFEPRIKVFQQIQVDSIEPGNSGPWKVWRIDHMGTISGAICENMVTEVSMIKQAPEIPSEGAAA